jgi:hypothetical protein
LIKVASKLNLPNWKFLDSNELVMDIYTMVVKTHVKAKNDKIFHKLFKLVIFGETFKNLHFYDNGDFI